MLNAVFGNVELSEAEMQTLIWLVKRAENTVANVVSAIRKAMTSDASGGNCSPVRRAGKAPGRAQRQLLMDGTAVKSAFALLSAKVTKPMCLSAQNMTDKKKWRERCKPIGEND